ncbi:MAG TPA: helix-turn-helix domain-containing protein [Longimicrobium sp.]|nr:helix-turn-helix domain-containing protein [Longimicrobium sp.]
MDPYFDSARSQVSPGLRSITVDFPSVPVLAALVVGSDDADVLVRVGGYGVSDIISIGHDDTTAALRHRFGKAECRPLKLLVGDILPADLGGRARAILDSATHIVSGGGHARDLAASLGVSRRTLLRWSEIAALPPPRRLLAWMRILLAAELLDDPGRSVLGVAQACGYSSDSGLRRVTMKFVGLTPTELRKRGAFAGATKQFLRELKRGRERPRLVSRAA